MVPVTGPLATVDPGNQEKGNLEALAKTGIGLNHTPNRIPGCWLWKSEDVSLTPVTARQRIFLI